MHVKLIMLLLGNLSKEYGQRFIHKDIHQSIYNNEKLEEI